MCLYLLFELLIACSIEVTFGKGGLADGYSLYDIFLYKNYLYMTKIKVTVQFMSAYLWLCEFSGIPPFDGCISTAGHQLCAWLNILKILSSALCRVKHIVISSVPD